MQEKKKKSIVLMSQRNDSVLSWVKRLFASHSQSWFSEIFTLVIKISDSTILQYGESQMRNIFKKPNRKIQFFMLFDFCFIDS